MKVQTLFGYRLRRFCHRAGGHEWRLKWGAYKFSVTHYPEHESLRFLARLDHGGVPLWYRWCASLETALSQLEKAGRREFETLRLLVEQA